MEELDQKANQVRENIVKMLEHAGSGHSAGPLGMADLLVALYFKIMNVDPKNPEKSDRDVLFLSNGHTAPVLYATLAEKGYFDTSELMTLRQRGSRLQGHPERTALPGLESTSGPLGSGLSQAAGYAYSLQYFEGEMHRMVYCITGDGELNEGNIWEAVMFAGHHKLSQLTVFVDRNNIQIDGPCEEVMSMESLADKWRSFGWYVMEVDGHNIEEIVNAANRAKAVTTKPCVILTYTIPGKGVDFMEYKHIWHGMPPNKEQAKEALEKLRTLDGKITHEGADI